MDMIKKMSLKIFFLQFSCFEDNLILNKEIMKTDCLNV